MTIDAKKIFVVSGHNVGFEQAIVDYLERLGATPVILVEGPSRGMTIIERLEKYSSDVGFAIILMTGDDRGGKISGSYNEQKPRARQNVVFELGYLIGRLGRDRVSVLYENDIEIPSDYAGVNYIPYDKANRWKLSIARELITQGLDIKAGELLPGDPTTDAPPPPPKKD